MRHTTPSRVAEADAFLKSKVAGGRSVEWAEIDAALAVALLRRATRHPTLDAQHVAEMAEAVAAAGRWRPDGRTVIVASDGVLHDGLHRLAAVAVTGIALSAPLVFGDDPASFHVIDWRLDR